MKKNLLTVLILALLIVNLVLTGVMMFSVINTNSKTAELVSNIATALNLQLTVPGSEPEKEPVSLADTAVYNITGPMTIPLTVESGSAAYIMFDVSLSMDTKHKDYGDYKDTIGDYESLIKDDINSVVASHTEAECRNDIEGLKAEILEALQNRFQSDFIYSISVSGVRFMS